MAASYKENREWRTQMVMIFMICADVGIREARLITMVVIVCAVFIFYFVQ